MGKADAELSEVRALARYLAENTGIALDDSKAYLFETRCRGLLLELGCKSLGCLLEQAQKDISGRTRQALIDAMSTNETSFFREAGQFTLLSHHVIPQHFEQYRGQRMKVWSAAASTGQEPYSLGILFAEMFGTQARQPEVQILGSDISDAALARASKGRYSELEASRGLSPERRNRFFVRRHDQWEIIDPVRALVTFQRVNLMDSLKRLGIFDLILCRNVAIYFTPASRDSLFRRLAEQLRPGGVLLLSVTEAVPSTETVLLRKEHRGVVYYQRPVAR